MKIIKHQNISTVSYTSDEDNYATVSTRTPEGEKMVAAIEQYIATSGHTLYDAYGLCLIGDVGELTAEIGAGVNA